MTAQHETELREFIENQPPEKKRKIAKTPEERIDRLETELGNTVEDLSKLQKEHSGVMSCNIGVRFGDLEQLVVNHLARQTVSMEAIQNMFVDLSGKYKKLLEKTLPVPVSEKEMLLLKHRISMDRFTKFLGGLILTGILAASIVVPGYQELNMVNVTGFGVGVSLFGASFFSKFKLAENGGVVPPINNKGDGL